MKPVLLIHGYSSEGENKTVDQIYGSLPADLREWFGPDAVRELDLSRWISLSDGISLDDVSFAMERALRNEYSDLLKSGFHVIIHSTGALVVRNWIRLFSPKPGPIINLVHLAGANFGSGLAHIGQGQLARWGRYLTIGTGCGYRILDELEFGSGKTLDLHLHFLPTGRRMLADYRVREFCLIGSQIPGGLHMLPIRYVHEDSSDCTVRTSAGNLNFSYIKVEPSAAAWALDCKKLRLQTEKRLDDKPVATAYYRISGESHPGDEGRPLIPFSILYETTHYGDETGIVEGSRNRDQLRPLIQQALNCSTIEEYTQAAAAFQNATGAVFQLAAGLRPSLTEWDPQEQYEGHAQLIFRLRDQQGNPVEHFDVFLKSDPDGSNNNALENMLEDRHVNKKDIGTITFYLRTQQFNKKLKNPWKELLDQVAPLTVEITGEEPGSGEINYVPLTVKLTPDDIRRMIKTFRTTVVDVTLLRLPSAKVFEIVSK